MHPGALIAAFISFWSISAVGVYLIVAGLSDLGHQGSATHPGGILFFLRQRLFQSWDIFLLLLGTLLAGLGVFFLYMVAYG